MTDSFSRTRGAFLRSARRSVAAVAILSLAACSSNQGPAVPTRPGMSLYDARAAVDACQPAARPGGQGAVVGSYVFGILFLGLLVGGVAAAASEEQTRALGEADGVDRCLKDMGYERRKLTAEEFAAVNQASRYERERLLSHFVGGGTLQTYR